MARRIRDNVIEVAPDSATSVGYDKLFEKRNSRPPKKPGISDRTMLKLVEQTREFAKSTDWSKAEGKHFVALYEWMHEETYGVDSGTSAVDRLAAVSCANSMLRTKFDGNPADMADYMRWAWTRERGREKWRRENDRDGGRITWRLMFSGAIYTDYRLALLRGKT